MSDDIKNYVLFLGDKAKMERALGLDTDLGKIKAEIEPLALTMSILQELIDKGILSPRDVAQIYSRRDRYAEDMSVLALHAINLQVASEHPEFVDDLEIEDSISKVLDAGSRVLYYPCDPSMRDEFQRVLDAANELYKELKEKRDGDEDRSERGGEKDSVDP